MRFGNLGGAWRTLLLVCVIAAAATFLAACGDEDDDSPASAAVSATLTTALGAPTAEATAPSPNSEPLTGTLTVFAAASLTDAFGEVAEAFTAANPEVEVEFQFAGSSALRAQLEHGAAADIFASADAVQMANAVASGVVSDESTVFVRNSLVVITPSDNPGNVNTLAGLENPGLKLVLAAPEVPVGNYARQVLEKANADPAFGAGFSEAVLANLVSNEANVRQVVTKIELGEGDAGIVYGSDVTPSVAPSLAVIEIPQAVNVIAEYPIALTSDSDNHAVAQAFIEFVLSDEGQGILEAWGFLPYDG